MKLLTRDTDYAMRALCCIAEQKEKVVSVERIIRCLKLPRPFLRKILQILQKKKLLVSYRGKGGGFSLARPAEKIYLIDIMRIFQGPISINECTFKKKGCPEVNTCFLREKLIKIEKQVIQQLDSITLASLLK